MDPQSERRKEIQEKRRTMAYIKSKNFSRPRSIDCKFYEIILFTNVILFS